MLTLPETVRETCARVTRDATLVTIDDGALNSYAASLSFAGVPRPAYDLDFHFRGEPEATIAFILTLDSVNFGSGYFPYLRKRPGQSGYFTIAGALTDHFRTHGPLLPAALREATPDFCAALFEQDHDNPVAMELMRLFARAWRDLGAFGGGYHDDFAGVVSAAHGSGVQLAANLTAMPLFQDVGTYRGAPVAFYKRAQITVADLALAFDYSGPGCFTDLAQLTMFADNLVPHVLRVDGVLRYDPALLDRITRGELLTAGSPEEVEIRAVALTAVEAIVAALRARGQHVTAMDVDNLLWYRGGGAMYKAAPRHRTRTPFY